MTSARSRPTAERADYTLVCDEPDIDAFTPYADLDELLVELTVHWSHILGKSLAGADVQGSFALGSGDQLSDCDWLVTTHGPLAEPHIAQLRESHDEISTRERHWSHDLEGLYAPVSELTSVEPEPPRVQWRLGSPSGTAGHC